jgi:hypothetical protein
VPNRALTRPAASLLLAVASLTGCLSLADPFHRGAAFEDTQRDFTMAIRLGEWDEAAEFVEPASRERWRSEVEALSEIRLTEFDVLELETSDGRTRGRAVVRFRGFELSAPVERTLTMTQLWRREPGSSRWFVTPDFRGRERLEEAGFRSAAPELP